MPAMKRVLITGATSGLGRGLALQYASSATTLGLVARRGELLEQLAEELKSRGARPLLYPADVCETGAMKDVIGEFQKQAGGIDLCIANAGLGEGRPRERFDPSKVARVLETNVIGLSNTLLPSLQVMRAQNSGVLVGIASIAAFRALPGSLAYSASKSAVLTFMEGLQLELSETPIHAMAICPGFIRTPLTERNNFSMPFLMDCEHACKLMQQAIERRRRRYVFPLPMAVAAQLARLAPQSILRLLLPSPTRSH